MKQFIIEPLYIILPKIVFIICVVGRMAPASAFENISATVARTRIYLYLLCMLRTMMRILRMTRPSLAQPARLLSLSSS